MTTLSDIVGSSVFVEVVRKHIVDPVKGNKKHSKRVVIYGPPGTGKTFVAKAIAGELGLKFVKVRPSDSAGAVRKAVESATPVALVFLDEAEKFKADVLRGIGEDVLVVGATNYPWKIEKLMEAGFSSLVFMPEPDSEARKGIFRHNLGGRADSLDLDRLAEVTEGFTAADIQKVCASAGKGPLSTEALESAASRHKPLEFRQWLAEAKVMKEELDSVAFAPMLRWLEGK